MNKITIYITLIFLLFLGSCKTKIQYVPVKELEFHNVYFRDTTIKTILIPYRDSTTVKDTSSYLKNKYADSWAIWNNGFLSHSLNIFPDTIPINLQIQEVEILREVEIPIEIEKKLTKWQKIKMDFGGWSIGVLSGIIIIGIIYLIIKRKF